MARAKRKPTRSRASKPKKKAAPKARPKAPKKKPARRGKAAPRGTGHSAEVQGRWDEYWSCRTELEEAVAAVTEAQQALQVAIDLERERREVFERTKNSLKQLLEVEPAAASPVTAAPARPKLLNLDSAPDVVDEEDDDDDEESG